MFSTRFKDGVLELISKKHVWDSSQPTFTVLVVGSGFQSIFHATSLTSSKIFVAGILAKAIYNLFFHPLSGYPGPLLWRAFRLPYVVRALQGYLSYDMLEIHKRYGPVVRVAPNELALAYEGVWGDVQGGGYETEMPKWKPFCKYIRYIMRVMPTDKSSLGSRSLGCDLYELLWFLEPYDGR